MKLSEIRQFLNEDSGVTIFMQDPVDKFLGTPKFFANLVHPVGTPNGQQVMDQFRIDIPAETIEQAFEMLPAMVEPARAKRVEELNRANRLIPERPAAAVVSAASFQAGLNDGFKCVAA